MVKIHYICHYKDLNIKTALSYTPSAIAKINYIKYALRKANFKIILFSVSEGNNSHNKFIRSITNKIDDQETHKYISTFGRKIILLKLLSRIFMLIQLFHYLLFKVKKNDKILVYHSISISPIITIFKLLSNKQLYYEIEESYAAAYGQSQAKIDAECRLWQNVSGYICVNDIIAEKCRLKGKVAVCYGDYRTKVISDKIPTIDKIHVLYAGFIEKEGTDAFIAVETALYLKNNYYINILGYGEDTNILLLKKRIEEINSQLGYNAVEYHGCLQGKSFTNLIQNYHIGLTTRVLNDSLSDYTFPSKTLAYLCNNLIPVCSPLSCIRESTIRDYVYFCNDITPQAVAKTVLAIDITRNINYTELLRQLDNNFVLKLKEVFA